MTPAPITRSGDKMRRNLLLVLLVAVAAALAFWGNMRWRHGPGLGAKPASAPSQVSSSEALTQEDATRQPTTDEAPARLPPVGSQRQESVASTAVEETSQEQASSGKPSAPPLTVVVWISVDGLRGDYIDLADTPFFDRFLSEGAYSVELAPVFPSLTFPSHVSQCTGAPVRDHGIIGNALYDLVNDHPWPYPNDNSLILCEPIWNTAQRQGRRSAVFDWPVSQKQTGPHAADYFTQSYDTKLSDRDRLEQLWDAWERDREPQSLQLLMTYFSGVDSAGHKYGPSAPQTRQAVEQADALLAESFQRCEQLGREKHGDNVVWYFLVSTDHGMEDVHTLVSLRGLLGEAYTDDVRSVTSGSVANIFLNYVPDGEARRVRREHLLDKLRRHEFAHAYAREDLPEEWDYDCPGRTGDIVVSLDPGHFFSEGPGPPIRPVDPSSGPLGMHGYTLADCPQMNGFLGIWRSGMPLGGVNLGPVDSLRLHRTVAQLLEIEPAPTSRGEPLPGLKF